MREPRTARWYLPVAVLALFVFVSCARTSSLARKERPAGWAQPIALKGVPNLHRVSDELYRSAQPSREGMNNLEKSGIKTVINLRIFGNDQKEIGSLDLREERIPVFTWAPYDDADERFFEILKNSPQPVLLHCLHGSDRTGAFCALYRIKEQGWSEEEALAEMTRGGFGFHSIWKNLPHWVGKQTGASGRE